MRDVKIEVLFSVVMQVVTSLGPGGPAALLWRKLDQWRTGQGDPREWDDLCEAVLTEHEGPEGELLDAIVCVCSCYLNEQEGDCDIIIYGAQVRRFFSEAALCRAIDPETLQRAKQAWKDFLV